MSQIFVNRLKQFSDTVNWSIYYFKPRDLQFNWD